MLKQNITYTTFDGETVTEPHYFNLTASELMELEVLEEGSATETFSQRLARVGSDGTPKEILETFKWLIEKSYGRRSEDGKRFEKSPEISKEFFQSLAYEAFMEDLMFSGNNAEVSANFVNGIMPSKLMALDTTEASNQIASTTQLPRVIQQVNQHHYNEDSPGQNKPLYGPDKHMYGQQ